MAIKLHRDVNAAKNKIIKQAKKYGIKVKVTSGVRTAAQQKKLASSDNKYPVATPGRSQHEYGFAIDMVASPWSPGQEIIVAWWKSAGGYHDWSDAVHFAAYSPQQWAQMLGQVEAAKDFFLVPPAGSGGIAQAVGMPPLTVILPDLTPSGQTSQVGTPLTEREAFQNTILGGAAIPARAIFVSVKAGYGPAFEVAGVNDGLSLKLAEQGWTRYAVPPV